MNTCFLPLPKLPKCFVHLGRYGDLMIMMPLWKKLQERDGIAPVVVVCAEFADLFEGASYINPWPVQNFNWFADVKLARKIAEHWFGEVVVPKWWDEPGRKPRFENPWENRITLLHQGHHIEVGESAWKSFMLSQWVETGHTLQELVDWPLVFDNRSPAREESLGKRVSSWKRPVVLYNFTGISNRCPFEPEIIGAARKFSDRLELVNLGGVRAERIYDLLGLYDRALCLITGDTSTLHLAAASKVPTIALLADGGAGSIVKANCPLVLRYGEIRSNLHRIESVIEMLLNRKQK